MDPAEVGDLIDGYCGGMWGLDGIGATKRIEAIGPDWVVVRDTATDKADTYADDDMPERLAEYVLR